MSYSGLISSFSPAHHRSLTRKTNFSSAAVGTTIPIRNQSLDGESSEEIIARAKKYILNTYNRFHLAIKRGKGCKVYDFEGREYLDLTSGIAVNALGHGDPDSVSAMSAQAEELGHTSNIVYTGPQGYLAQRLITNSFADFVFFSNDGTGANEAAIKFSRKFQRFSHPDGKEPPLEFIAFSNSFHGRTMGALALTSKEEYRMPFEPVMFGVTFLKYDDSEAAVDLIRSGNFAGVFVEPLQGEGGIYSASKSFLQSLRDACNEAGCLLIFDEVQCGFGRTGRLWAHEEFGVYPDIMTLAKSLGGGLPIGATLLTERVASTICVGDHGSTFAGGPIICATACVAFDKISNPDFLSSVVDKGSYFKQSLLEKVGANPHVKEIRGCGLIIGVELDVLAAPLVDACQEAGLLVLTAGKGNVVRLVPPLIISKEELDQAVEILVSCFHVLG